MLHQARAEPVVDRSQAQVARFFDGLDLLEPGVVQIDEWRPEGEAPAVPGGARPPWFGAVAAKPQEGDDAVTANERLRELQLVTSVLPILRSNPAVRGQFEHRLASLQAGDTGRWSRSDEGPPGR